MYPLKGSIPARIDVDRSKFDSYHQWAMDSFASGKLLPSCVHGEAAPAAFQQALVRLHQRAVAIAVVVAGMAGLHRGHRGDELIVALLVLLLGNLLGRKLQR